MYLIEMLVILETVKSKVSGLREIVNGILSYCSAAKCNYPPRAEEASSNRYLQCLGQLFPSNLLVR